MVHPVMDEKGFWHRLRASESVSESVFRPLSPDGKIDCDSDTDSDTEAFGLPDYF
jgi:hypothetical protein